MTNSSDLNFSLVIGSKTLQLTIRLILHHFRPFLEDRENFVFVLDCVCPNLPCGVIDEGHDVRGTT